MDVSFAEGGTGPCARRFLDLIRGAYKTDLMKDIIKKGKYSAPPKPEEYLPSAINKAVVQTGMKHPITVYPIALGVSACVVGWLFSLPILLGSGVGVALLGPLWAVSQIFFRHDALGGQYLNLLHKRQKKYEASLILRIESGLKECAKTVHLKAKAETGIDQLKNIRNKLTNVRELLDMKLNANEITYGRFLGAAEQVELSVLDNLNAVVGHLKSTTSINVNYIDNRIKEIKANKALNKEESDQLKSLRERLSLWNGQLQKIDRLMARNEAAMTEMERISAAVAQWQTDLKFSGTDFESAIKKLHALAVQAHEYEKVS